MKSPGALTVISSSQCTFVCHHQKDIVLHVVPLLVVVLHVLSFIHVL